MVHHSRQHVARAREALYLLCLQLDGLSVTRQQGRDSVPALTATSILLDSSRPYQLSFAAIQSDAGARLPTRDLERRLANPESVIGLPMSGSIAAARPALFSAVRILATTLQRRGPLPFAALQRGPARSHRQRLCLDRRGAGTDESSIAVARREQVRSYIESHLHDPALTPARLAAAVHLSTAPPAPAFRGGRRDCRGSYILRRRLEECARAIADPSQRGRTVTEIAFLHGFNNASHFGRVFRERFAATPSEFRSKNASS